MRTKKLSNEERQCIAEFLLEHQKAGVVAHKKADEASKKWAVSARTVGKIWAIAREQRASGLAINVMAKRNGKKSRPKQEINSATVMEIPLKSRKTLRRLGQKLGVSKSTVGRWAQNGVIRRHSNAIKPELTQANKYQRLQFCLSKLMHDSVQNLTKFKDMSYDVHLDEKWFYLSTASEKYYLMPEEANPYRSCKSKKFIPKVLPLDELLTAVQEAYHKLEASTLNKIFISLQACMIEIMKKKGGNDYQLPHMNKSALERLGQLPTDLHADNELVMECVEYLMDHEQTNNINELMGEMGNSMCEDSV